MTEPDYDKMEQEGLDYRAGYEDGWRDGYKAGQEAGWSPFEDPNQPKLAGWDVT